MAGTASSAPAGDPSDLGRRVAARRLTLGRTVEEVAGKAGMAPDYLRRVEGSTGVVVRAAAVTKLARALDTTAAALLGTSTHPPGHGASAAGADLVPVAEEECWQLIARGGVGRLVFDGERGPTALPVNYRVYEHAIAVRTEPGSQFSHLAGQGSVGFEVDRLDEALSEGWSVFASGTARLARDGRELEALQSLGVDPWAGGEREAYLVLEVTEITGRHVGGER